MAHKEKVLIFKGIDRVKRRQYAEAIEIFDKVLAENPQSTDAWNNKGVALFRSGQPEEALEAYGRSLAIDEKNLDALRNKGFVLRALGRLDEALEAYDAVMTVGGDAMDLEAIAAIFVGQGKLDEALGVLSEAMKADPVPRFEDEMKMIMELKEKRTEALGQEAGKTGETGDMGETAEKAGGSQEARQKDDN